MIRSEALPFRPRPIFLEFQELINKKNTSSDERNLKSSFYSSREAVEEDKKKTKPEKFLMSLNANVDGSTEDPTKGSNYDARMHARRVKEVAGN